MARRVCWLEGERDVEALWAWGLPSTTCAGGVESWRAHAQDYIGQLVLAGCQEFLIFRDHDLPGGRLQRAVARAALENGLKVKLLDLGYPEVVSHGKDLSDWIAEGHTKEELLALLEATPWLTAPLLEPGEIPPPPPDPTEGEWPEVGPYLVKQGVLCRKRGINGTEWAEPLCDFRARIAEQLLLDDGLQQSREFLVKGWTATGKPLETVRVSAPKFAGMSWVMERWGSDACIKAGQSAKDYIREAMQRLSRPGIRHVYTHTGWRWVPGAEWVYLTASGAVGREGFEVDLEKFSLYRLPPIPEKARSGAELSLKLLDLAPWSLTVPLLGSVYRAVLGEWLKIDYSLWLEGQAQNYKSSLAALFLAHWGPSFHRLTLPESWGSTANALEKTAFTLKDCWLVIDDYHPTVEGRDQEMKAARLIRSQGNLTGRGRLRQDLTTQTTFVPRGLIVGTGEQHPGGQSLVGRMLVLEVDGNKINVPLLTRCQRAQGLLSHALAGFVEWLAPQMPAAKVHLLEIFEQAREKAVELSTRHARIPEIVANCWTGFVAFTDFALDVGALTEPEREALQDRAWDAMLNIAEEQRLQVEEERPSRRFFSILQTLLLQRRVTLLSPGQSPNGLRPPPDFVGWDYSEEEFCLDTGVYQLVSKFARDAGEPFLLRQPRLYRDFLKEGLLIFHDPDHTTGRLRLGGEVRRILRISKRAVTALLSAPFAIAHGDSSQTMMNTDQYQGDNPF